MSATSALENSSKSFLKEEIETSLPKRFERQVDKYAAHSAVKTRTQELSYGELNRKSNKIARLVGPNKSAAVETVALVLETGLDMVFAILGVLKAGKTWVSLDPIHPYDRISYILKDSAAKIILTNEKNLGLASKLRQKENALINIDDINPNIEDGNLDLPISSESYAHIIYTSGSSGQPKGVIHTHRLQLHNIWLHTASFGIDANDRISLLSSFGYLAGITAMLRALLNGACLLPFNIKNEGIFSLKDWLVEESITIYQSVPTVFRQLMNSLKGDEKFPDMRIVHLGGEAVHKHDAELCRKHFGEKCVLVSNYGSSETGTLSQYFIGKDTNLDAEIVPVGFSVEDKEVLILDETGKIVEKEQIGQIAVKSSFLASGYWRNREMTERLFVSDPIDPDVKLYKTGDMGHMRPDGCLIISGRKDNQVKIGGQRIELSEIENVLLANSKLKSGAVVIRNENRHESYLAAYIELKNQEEASIASLRDYLKQKLPDFMIPSKFIFLKSMPLLPNGKIDRRSLPAPDRLRPELTTDYVAPESDIEKRVADICKELLRIDQVGVNDDFFELGGQSLLATQLLSRINQAFGIAIPLKLIFEAPTVKGIALLIDMVVGSAANETRGRDSAAGEREQFVL